MPLESRSTAAVALPPRPKAILLMGPTDANRNGPYGQLENAIEVDRPCRYCWKRACPKGLDCLSRISVEQVREKCGV